MTIGIVDRVYLGSGRLASAHAISVSVATAATRSSIVPPIRASPDSGLASGTTRTVIFDRSVPMPKSSATRPARPGQIAKRDNEDERWGTANIFAIVEPMAGRHLTASP